MKTTHSPVVSKIDNRLEQYTSAAQVGTKPPSCLIILAPFGGFIPYKPGLGASQIRCGWNLTPSCPELSPLSPKLVKLSDFPAPPIPLHQIFPFSRFFLPLKSAALSLQRENKESRSPRSGAVDLPVVTDIRNIKSMWEKGSVFSSPGGGGGQFKVKGEAVIGERPMG